MKNLLRISVLILFCACSPNDDDPCIDKGERFVVVYETDDFRSGFVGKIRYYATFEPNVEHTLIQVSDVENGPNGSYYDSAYMKPPFAFSSKYNEDGTPIVIRPNFNPPERSGEVKCDHILFTDSTQWDLVD